MTKFMCGLWHAHVTANEHNDTGQCGCIGCGGTHCQMCRQYQTMVAKNMADLVEQTRCARCLAAQERTR